MDSFLEYVSVQKADVGWMMNLTKRSKKDINFDVAGKCFPNEVVIKYKG